MNSVVITGTGLITATRFQSESASEPWSLGAVAESDLTWPVGPIWEVVRELASPCTKYAVSAAMKTLSGANVGVFANSERAAVITIARDDWSQQSELDRALARCASSNGEARALFEGLDDKTRLQSLRWATGFFLAVLSRFAGPSLNVDVPSYAGLAGLRVALDWIASGDLDAVLLVGASGAPRVDFLDHLLARLPSYEPGKLAKLGRGAAAVLIESEHSALQRKATVLARVTQCELVLGRDHNAALRKIIECLGHDNSFVRTWTNAAWSELRAVLDDVCVSTARERGVVLDADGLIHLVLAAEELRAHGVPARARVLELERFCDSGAAGVILESVSSMRSEA